MTESSVIVNLLQVRAISSTEQKVRGLGGSCIYAYEVNIVFQISSSVSTVQVTKSAEKVTNTGERREGEDKEVAHNNPSTHRWPRFWGEKM